MATIDNLSGRGALIPFTRDRMAAAGSLTRASDTGLLAGGGGAYFSRHRRRSPEMDRRIAFHEAGHVVVGRALGQQIGGVTIEPGHQSTVIQARITADMERRDRLVEKWTRAMNNGDRVERMDIEKELAEVNRRLRECGELLRHGSYLCGASKEERVA